MNYEILFRTFKDKKKQYSDERLSFNLKTDDTLG